VYTRHVLATIDRNASAPIRKQERKKERTDSLYSYRRDACLDRPHFYWETSEQLAISAAKRIDEPQARPHDHIDNTVTIDVL
jgi:hypothetical protein